MKYVHFKVPVISLAQLFSSFVTVAKTTNPQAEALIPDCYIKLHQKKTALLEQCNKYLLKI